MDIHHQQPQEATEPTPRYDEGVLYANWNPAIGLAMSAQQTGQALRPQLPADLTTIDVDTFLDRFYTLAARI